MMRFRRWIIRDNEATIELLPFDLLSEQTITQWIKDAFDQSVTPEYGADWLVWPIHLQHFWLLRYCCLTSNLWFELQVTEQFCEAGRELCSYLSRYIEVPHG
ncbi:hypothetical protein [Celerinatantimonas sp. MCCC 1A17872]|uniref:hypothetical protein n=1 Tax=Celerinatantimonas sp. MCCC 1A17872 TaxID=3177514 RepID=UPI0038C94A8B